MTKINRGPDIDGDIDILPEKCPSCNSKKLSVTGILHDGGALIKLKGVWKIQYVFIDEGLVDAIYTHCIKCGFYFDGLTGEELVDEEKTHDK